MVLPWHGAVDHIKAMATNIRSRCRHGYGTLATTWKALVMLSEMGIHVQQKGYVQIPCEEDAFRVVNADAMLTHCGISLHGFWNYRGHARQIQGRRLSLIQQTEPRSAADSLALWLLELIMDTRPPPHEMDTTAGEEFATDPIARHLLYDAGITGVVEFLGLRNSRVVLRRQRKRRSRERSW
jgi:hypothetical protein